MKKTACISTMLLLVLASCSTSRIEDRVDAFKKCKPADEFMACFLSFVKDADLYEPLVQYEEELVKKEYLKSYDCSALYDYADRMVAESESKDSRCTSSDILERVKPHIHEFIAKSEEYGAKVENGSAVKTKEYSMFNYLNSSGGEGWQIALQNSIKDNPITIDKKYFYLFCTIPGKKCEPHKSPKGGL